MLAIAFPYFILNDLHQSVFFLGTIFAVATLFTALFGLMSGTMTDIWGRKKTLLAVSMLLPLGSLLLWVSGTKIILFLAAILGGFSATGSLAGGGIGGAVMPIQNTVLADLVPSDRRTFYYSFFAFLNGFAAAFGTVFIKVMAIREVFLGAAVISLFGTVILLFLDTPEIKGEFRKLESKIVISKFTLTGFLNGISQGLVTPFLIPFFILAYKVPESRMSSYTFLSGVIASLALLVAPFADKRFGFVKSITYSRAATVILLLILPVMKIFPLAIFIYCITPALRVLAVPIQQTAITSMVEDRERGRALGINQAVRLIGSSLATELAGGFLSIALIAVPFYLYGVTMGVNIYLYKRFFSERENN